MRELAIALSLLVVIADVVFFSFAFLNWVGYTRLVLGVVFLGSLGVSSNPRLF